MEFFGYRKCSTCREAHRHLQARGFDVEFQDFVAEPPSEATLRDWIAKCGEGVEPFINTKGTQYRALGLKDKHLSEDEWIHLLTEDGKLLKRPVLVTDDQVIIGYDKLVYESLGK